MKIIPGNWSKIRMGLCKCPKRQVTNQFCFEHRVNVCEHCMVNSHPKVIVLFQQQKIERHQIISKLNHITCFWNKYSMYFHFIDIHYLFLLNSNKYSIRRRNSPLTNIFSIFSVHSSILSAVAERQWLWFVLYIVQKFTWVRWMYSTYLLS